MRGRPSGEVCQTEGRKTSKPRVNARLQRQERLASDDPLKLWAIIDGAVLRREVGGADVMQAQLQHLSKIAELPAVTLQVIPFGVGAYPGMSGEFVILRFEEPVGADVVYIESMAGDLFLETPAGVTRYTLMFEHLRALALSPDDSVTLVRNVAEGMK